MTRRAAADALDEGLAGLALDLDAGAREALLAYLELLRRWNRVYNLTAVRDPLDMVRRHLLDSLAVLPYTCGPRLLDVGSGAGLPGIPLAVARPDLACTLLDSNGKKTRFCVQAAAELGLANVAVVRRRVQEYRPEAPFNTIVSRAFADLGAFVAASRHLLAEGGRWLAMKGAPPAAELDGLPGARVETLRVPGLDARRHLVVIPAGTGSPAPAAETQHSLK